MYIKIMLFIWQMRLLFHEINVNFNQEFPSELRAVYVDIIIEDI